MLVIFVIGQWAVVEFGTRLRAAPDIAGTWSLSDDPTSSASKIPSHKMTIGQSGKFLDVFFDNGIHVPARIESEDSTKSGDDLHLSGTKYIFTAEGQLSDGQLRCFLQLPNWVTLPAGPFDATMSKGLNDYRFVARKDVQRAN
jgi:hypothetical protein